MASASGGERRLGDVIPVGWKADHIVYCRVTLDGNKKKVKFSYDPSPPPIIRNKTIEKFIEELTGPKATKVQSTETALLGPTPLDFEITKQCHVVFHLDKDCDWQFRPAGDAITTKSDKKTKYFDLQHVPNGGGKPIPSGGKPGDECYIAYFSTARPGKTGFDSFNLHIEFIQSGKHMEVKIDPDIRNNGGGPPPPPPPPPQPPRRRRT